jgi:soluble lytic murein transglycosylase
MRNNNFIGAQAMRAIILALALLFAPSGIHAQDATPEQGQTESPNANAAAASAASAATTDSQALVASQGPTLPEPPPLVMDLPLAQGAMGAEAWYYEAKKLEKSAGSGTDEIAQRSIDFMYSLAFHFGEKAAAKEAGKALLQRLEKRPDANAHRQAAAQWLDYFGPDWDIYKSLIVPALAAGDNAFALETAATLRAVAPSVAKAKASELAWYEYSARAAQGDYSWYAAALAGAKAAALDAWASKTLRLAAAAPDIDDATRETLLMRADYRDKEYGKAALHAAGAAPLILAKGAPRVLVSEAGKSFISAGAAADGAAFMMAFFPEVGGGASSADLPDAIASALAARRRDENAWVAAYYLGRLWMSSGREREAAILFLSLTDNAPGDADADSALWYWLDITMRRIAAEDIASFDTAAPAIPASSAAPPPPAGPAAPPAAPNNTPSLDAPKAEASVPPAAAPDQTAPATPPAPALPPAPLPLAGPTPLPDPSPAPGPVPVPTTAPAPDPAAAIATAKRSLELGALLEASTKWKNPAYFADIVEAYDRTLLRSKAWNEVLALGVLIGERIASDTKTRLLYQSGRLVEEGLAAAQPAGSPAGDSAAAYFRKIIETPKVEEYYRTMASWRLGLDPPYLAAMPALSAKTQSVPASLPAAASPPVPLPAAGSGTSNNSGNGNGALSALSLIRNYLLYGLDEMASSLALNYIGSLDVSVIAGLAFDLSAEGQHYAALRLARDALNRGAGDKYPELYGLVYPKAWNEIIAQGAAIPKIPEALAYGIIRSESVFDPKAVSYAGAVGLTQLMPATAAETAKGLKMPGYSLTDPADNVKIGLTYYSYMLSRFGGKPMRAMFAYNAGPGRMAVWSKESGELPDDLLLETLSIEQPRQYAKNILQASLAFGKIHYGIEPRAMLNYLVNGQPIPGAPAVSPAGPAITETASPAPATPPAPFSPATPAPIAAEAPPAAGAAAPPPIAQ